LDVTAAKAVVAPVAEAVAEPVAVAENAMDGDSVEE